MEYYNQDRKRKRKIMIAIQYFILLCFYSPRGTYKGYENHSILSLEGGKVREVYGTITEIICPLGRDMSQE